MGKKNGSFDARFSQGTLELLLRGEIDHHNAVRIRGEMDGLICEYRPKKTVLVLSEIEFMDSSGLGLIMGRYALTKKLGGELCLRDPHPRIRKILQLAGIERMIPIDPKTAEEDERECGIEIEKTEKKEDTP